MARLRHLDRLSISVEPDGAPGGEMVVHISTRRRSGNSTTVATNTFVRSPDLDEREDLWEILLALEAAVAE